MVSLKGKKLEERELREENELEALQSLIHSTGMLALPFGLR